VVVRFGLPAQPVDVTPGGLLAINNDDGLPKRSPNRFRQLPSQLGIPQHHFLCRPHTTTTSLIYRPTVADKRGHDWIARFVPASDCYEKAKCKIAISPNATATSEQRTPLSPTIKAAKTITF
jgi:hypothetical protein